MIDPTRHLPHLTLNELRRSKRKLTVKFLAQLSILLALIAASVVFFDHTAFARRHDLDLLSNLSIAMISFAATTLLSTAYHRETRKLDEKIHHRTYHVSVPDDLTPPAS